MSMKRFAISMCGAGVVLLVLLSSQRLGRAAAQAQPPADDPVKTLVGRLDLERYKSTIKGLTQFGDRLQGTDRNKAAIDWIEAQLRSAGCAPERLHYVYNPAPPSATTATAAPAAPPSPRIASGEVRRGVGGSRLRGMTGSSQGNGPSATTSPNAQSDTALRALNTQVAPNGPRDEVYCTKVGTTHPDEMYIVGAHMDGRGLGEAADDNGSGTALVMELARIFSSPDVQTDRSIRFALWNNEEGGLTGSTAYVEQRAALQGKEDPPGSRRYPEPKWLGMIQHDMMLWDHGMPRADGTVSPEQRPEADVNIEFQITSKLADQAMKLAFQARDANETYATDYPAAVGHHMTNTDSTPFMDITPSISLRENERGMQTGAGWNPQYHQPTDTFSAYSDNDFRLGLNAAQTTLATVAQLAGATSATITAARRTLDIYLIDVEGGQSTLLVTPTGQSLLVDTGFAGNGGRDAGRILAAARDAGLTQIDFLLLTHFHPDHDGGVAEVARGMPIKTFIDHGDLDRTPAILAQARWAGDLAAYNAYLAVRATGTHLEPKPGDRLPLRGMDVTLVSSARATITRPLPGGGQANPACEPAAPPPIEPFENPRSTGFVLQFGAFRFVDLGDLSGPPLFALLCPSNLVGPVDLYLVPHHGGADSSYSSTFVAMKPRVAIVNNGATKGGSIDVFANLRRSPGLEDGWQLHTSKLDGVVNLADSQIANLDETTGHWLKASATPDGAFTVTNGRTGVTKRFAPRRTP